MLILRPLKPMLTEQLDRLREHLQKKGIDALVLPSPDFEVLDDSMQLTVEALSARITVIEGIVSVLPPTEEADVDHARVEVEQAYTSGKVIEYCVMRGPGYTPEYDGRWFTAHRFTSPHKFDFDNNYYRLRTAR